MQMQTKKAKKQEDTALRNIFLFVFARIGGYASLVFFFLCGL